MRIFHRSRLTSRRSAMLLACALTLASGITSATTLSDIPVGSSSNVPANLMLALSVEYPTGTVAAYGDVSSYSATGVFLGYFDNAKCYDYKADSTNGVSYFVPVSLASSGSCVDSSGVPHWSGNMLNWATMTSLDEFRQSLTGGNRSLPLTATTPSNGDSTTLTVLLRSNLNSAQSSSTNFPTKQIGSSVNVIASQVIGDTDFTSQIAKGVTLFYLRSYALGYTFQVSNNSSFSSTGTFTTGSGSSKQTISNLTKTYNAAVQVCVESVGLESNCNKNSKNTYPNSGQYDKPEGLIQQNFQRIRVGASGYVFKLGNANPNGVVRALLRDNGPTLYNGNSPRTTNANSEWSASTGVFTKNPYPNDATGTAPGGGTATITGAINYLNQFGYGSGSSYEQYDTISDLYWATLAYFMNVPLDSSYTANLLSSNSLDTAFPVFASATQLNDPISYSCQANAIVTIGDAHTHYDTQIPGSTLSSVSGTGLPVIPQNGTVPAVNAAAYTTTLGNLPLIEGTTPSNSMAGYLGITALGNKVWGDKGTYYIAGLAYFAHTNDIRNDDPNNPATIGTQNVTTYTVDVLEPGSYSGNSTANAIYNPTSSTGGPDIYWLAAKYGGFNDINSNGIPANFLTWHTNTSTAAANNLRPDNYFPGNRPDLIQSGLAQIFNKVSTSTQSAAGPGVTLSRVLTNVPASATTAPFFSPVAGFPIYTVSYTPTAWVGDVTGYIASATAPGSVSPVTGSLTWSAQAKLDSLVKAPGATSTQYGWDTGRRIITFNGTKGIPFRYASLSASQQTALGSSSTLLNFLRGDQSNESTLYHVRPHILGDIVHSEAVLVQNALSPKYSESFNPGYTAYSTTVANRMPVVYAAANDGMLHAFEGDFQVPASTATNTVTGGGSELFAYVPSLLYNGPNSTPQVDGLAALANLNGVTTNVYAHHFYVDQTPAVADVDFNYTYTAGLPYASPATKSTSANASWHTLLVGGLGKGGNGFYALDVTSVPSVIDAISSTSAAEQTLATSKVLWEFTGTDMGYSYGAPLIVKTRKYGWVVLLTSGYNNATGIGHLYVLDAANGTLLETLNTTAGSASSPSGLAQATAYTKDVTDNTVEQVYAGDLLGNVWRFDLSGTGAYPAPTLLATLTDPSGNPQPVTTAPRVELDLNSTGLDTRRWVFVGTGQALDASDLQNAQQQTMYALRDGDGNAPSTTGLPISRNTTTLDKVTDLTKGANVSDTDAGWYYDLTGSAGAGGGSERIVVNPDAAAGTYTVAWATMTPTSDPCTLAGNIYAVSFGNGASALVDSNNNTMAYMTVKSAPTKIEEVQLPGSNQLAVLYGQSTGLPQVGKMRYGLTGTQLQRVNWREILNN
ncbi:pilus assembly protein [Dyella sp. 20L07]|uniref:pilus assembly protein n=1 Tax=Dyella sp. 20L07 TaxID=3384240 RepID=UPI003D26FDBD